MRRITLMLLALVLLMGCSNTSDFDDMTVRAGHEVAGRPLAEYANIWWQWTYTMPKELSPVADRTGENCHQGQQGDVWFLAGGYGPSRISRKCTIPLGKYVFFPVINMVHYPARDSAPSCERVKEAAALNNDELLSIFIELDGVSSVNSKDYRLSSPDCFDLLGMLPRDANAPKLYPSASDGYWVMLKPLEKGKHLLKFRAQYDRENGAYGKAVQDIQYEIMVE